MNHESSGLAALGWNSSFDAARERAGLSLDAVARVVSVHRGALVVRGVGGERVARISGRLRHDADESPDRLPVVGDWVGVTIPPDGDALVTDVLPRRNELARAAAGRGSERQLVAANLDCVLVVTSLDRDFNPRRLERYVAFVHDSGAQPVVLLTKSDLCGDVSKAIATAMRHAPGVEVLAVSAISGEGLEGVETHLAPGRTAVLVGSSGTGKSTLLNRLSHEPLQPTSELDHAGRGRHTTTRRELFTMPNGALVIDTPGLRELGVLVGRESLDDAFADIDSFAAACRFSDCTHASEPGCAVRAAVEEGRLGADRLESYQQLERERAWLSSRHEDAKRSERKREISLATRAFYRDHRKR